MLLKVDQLKGFESQGRNSWKWKRNLQKALLSLRKALSVRELSLCSLNYFFLCSNITEASEFSLDNFEHLFSKVWMIKLKTLSSLKLGHLVAKLVYMERRFTALIYERNRENFRLSSQLFFNFHLALYFQHLPNLNLIPRIMSRIWNTPKPWDQGGDCRRASDS